MDEAKFRKNVQIITVAAVVLIFILLLICITFIVQKVQLETVKAELQSQIDYLNNTEIKDLTDEIEYRKTLEYVEKYAREHLGLIGAYESLWKTK